MGTCELVDMMAARRQAKDTKEMITTSMLWGFVENAITAVVGGILHGSVRRKEPEKVENLTVEERAAVEKETEDTEVNTVAKVKWARVASVEHATIAVNLATRNGNAERRNA